MKGTLLDGKMWATIATAAILLGFPSVANASTRWKNQQTTGDWAVAANWTDGVPADNGVACFYRPSSTNFAVSVTPPASFTGTVIVSNNIAGVSGESYLNKRFYLMLSLNVLEGAQWKVKGNGHLVVTDGIADRIDPAFDGLVEVRKGTSFTAPATLNSKVFFIGAGELTLASVAQLSQASAFAGRVILPSGDVVVTDNATLADLDVDLSDGQTLTMSADDVAFGSVRPLLGFADHPEAWSYNGTAWRVGTLQSGPYNPNPPYVTSDGVLMLTDDPAQVHTVWYTNRMFRATDVFGMRFTWTPNLPNPSRITQEGRSQTQSGNLSILFNGFSPTAVKMPASMSSTFERNHQADNTWGFTMYTYQNEGNAHWSWIVNGTKPGYTESLLQKTVDIVLTKPIDFTVRVDGGVMTVTMEQQGKSISVRHNFGTLFSVCRSGGLYFGFGACSDTWGESDATVGTPWVKHEISNFNGWYRDPLEGGWSPVPDDEKYTTFNASNWNMLKVSKSANGSVVKKTGNDCVAADGSVMVIDGTTNNLAIMTTVNYIPGKTKPLRYRFDFYNEDTLFSKGSEFGISFLLAGSKNSATWPDSITYSSDYKWCGTGWMYGFGFDWRFDNGQGRWGYDHIFGTGGHATGDNDKSATSAWQSNISRADNFRTYKKRDIRADFVYDPRGRYRGVFCTSSKDGNYGQCTRADFELPAAWLSANNGMDWEYWKTERKSSSIGIRAKASVADYIQLQLTRFVFEQMTAAEAGAMSGVLRVPNDASATLKAGALMEGQTSRVATFRNAALAKDATLTVAPDGAATKVGITKVVSAGGATVAAASGAAVEVGDIELTGSDADTGVTFTGAVALGNTLTVTVPSAWQKSRNGLLTLVDAHAVTEELSLTPAGVSLCDENGSIPARKYQLKIANGKIQVSFANGMMLVIR